MRRPRSSVAIHVARSTGCSRAASPKATLAGLPPTCSSVSRPGAGTASTRASPMTRVRTGLLELPMPSLLSARSCRCCRTNPDGRSGARCRWCGWCRCGSASPGSWCAPTWRRIARAQQLAVGDAGRDEEALAGDEVVGGEHATEVVPGVEGLLPLLVVLGPQPALDDTAGALDGAGGDDPPRCPADAEEQVDARARSGRHDGARHVT